MKNLFLSLIAIPLVALSCGKGDEPSSETKQLDAPKNLTIKALTENSATIQWDPVEGAKTYGWEVTKDGAAVATGGGTTRNAMVKGLSAGTTYRFGVKASGEKVENSEESFLEFTTEGSSGPEQPVAGAVCVDAPIVLSFEEAPVLGTSGLIKVYDGGSVVDQIDLADLATVDIRDDGQMVPKEQIKADTKLNTFMDAIPSGKRWRIVHYTPLRIKGNKLEIKLHSGVLEFGKTYSIALDAGVVVGHPGIARGEMTFTTKTAPANPALLSVAADGTADFCTIQGALCHASTTKGAVTVSVANGTYNEMLYLRERADVSITGDSRDKCIIAYANAEGLETSSGGAASSKPSVGNSIGAVGGRGLCLFENCDNLVLTNLTVKNTYGAQGQAETIYFNSGSNAHKLVIENCALHSLQDTFLTKGQVWVHNSLIAGNVDFIWGYPKACLFEDCEIRCEKYSKGFIIQARVPSASDKGFVFLNCRITAGEGAADGSMYLARSAGQTDCFDNVTYINCQMSSVIAPAGWYTDPSPNPATPTATSGWKEFGTTGASTASRNSLGRILTADEAAAYSSKQAVLGW